jgi:AcrR family transcriptional regulator
VAQEVFGREGFLRARLEDIASAVRIRRPSLLYHYDTKEKLYGAVVHRAVQGLAEALQGAVQSPALTLEEDLARVIGAFRSYLKLHSEIARLLVRELMEPDAPGRDRLIAEVAPLVQWFERHCRKHHGVRIRKDLPITESVMIFSASLLLREACGEHAAKLWGDRDSTERIAAMLFVASDTPKKRGASSHA